MQPIRHGVIKRYYDKVKYMKAKREELLALVEDSDEAFKAVLGDDYVKFTDAFPGVNEFLAELEVKERHYPIKIDSQKDIMGDEEEKEVDLE
jgi:hypothetical protein